MLLVGLLLPLPLQLATGRLAIGRPPSAATVLTATTDRVNTFRRHGWILVCVRVLFRLFFDSHEKMCFLWHSKNVNVAIFSDTVNVMNVKTCRMVPLSELRPVMPFFSDLEHISRSQQCQIVLTENFML